MTRPDTLVPITKARVAISITAATVSKAIIVVPNDFQPGWQKVTPTHFRRFSCRGRNDFVGTAMRQVCLPNKKKPNPMSG